MWKRKSKNEIIKEQEFEEKTELQFKLKKLLRIFLASFIGAFLIFIVKVILGLNFSKGNPVINKSIKISELPQYLDNYLLLSLVFALGMVIMALIFPEFLKRHQSTTVICNICFRTKNLDNNEKCECGGIFEDFQLYKWIEEEKEIDKDETWIEKYKIMKNEA